MISTEENYIRPPELCGNRTITHLVASRRNGPRKRQRDKKTKDKRQRDEATLITFSDFSVTGK
jgi:hypothetical protein